MTSSNLRTHELMQVFANFLEKHGISYRIVGSLASMAYGEPRFTLDVDVVADLSLEKATLLCEAFPPPDFYISESAVRKAIASRHQFNILYIPSGLKIDVILPRDSDYSRMEMTRGKRLTSEGEFSAWFCSAEDMILNKLVYFKLGGSEKHLRDITGILKTQAERLDRDYVERWGAELGVLAEWQMVCARAAEHGIS